MERVLEGEIGSKTPSPPAPLPEGEGRLNDILEAGVFPGFGLSYLGRNTRGIKERFAALYGPFFRDAGQVSNLPGKRQIENPPYNDRQIGNPPHRIGFLVTRRHEGIFVRCMAGVLRHLDPKRFEPVVLAPRASIDLLKQRLASEQLRYVAFGETFGAAVRTIRAAACDLIYYWEVGSDAMNYFLPFARCAPVQCTSHGSLTTTGMPAIDWFFSSELMERPSPPAPLPEGEGSNMPLPPAPLPEGEGSIHAHYSERLWKSRTLLMCQERLGPVVPGAGQVGTAGRSPSLRLPAKPVEAASRFRPALGGHSGGRSIGDDRAAGGRVGPCRGRAAEAVRPMAALTPCPSPGG